MPSDGVVLLKTKRFGRFVPKSTLRRVVVKLPHRLDDYVTATTRTSPDGFDVTLFERRGCNVAGIAPGYGSWFQKGDPVYVLRHSRRGNADSKATIDSPLLSGKEAAGGRYAGRHRVTYCTTGATYHVRPERLIKLYVPDERHMRWCVVCESTEDYRNLAHSQPRDGDVVVEVGSSFGVCTEILSRNCKRCLGLDVSLPLVAESKRRYPGVEFRRLDVLTRNGRDKLVSVCDELHASVLFVDIGGDRDLASVVTCLAVVRQRLAVPPRLVVVKSEELFAHIRETKEPSPLLSVSRPSSWLEQFPAVEILEKEHQVATGGLYKYVLRKVTRRGGGEPPSSCLLFRAGPGEYHKDVARETVERLQSRQQQEEEQQVAAVGVAWKILGGGRLLVDVKKRRLGLYGYSVAYGRAPHDRSKEMLLRTTTTTNKNSSSSSSRLMRFRGWDVRVSSDASLY